VRPRIIPLLLLKEQGLYKTRKFQDPTYIGDPINAVRIFNEKEVDELCVLDIDAHRYGGHPKFDVIKDLASECFMPLCYGGGIRDIDMVREILSIGVERVVINSAAYTNPSLIQNLADTFGTSTIVVSIDVKQSWLGNQNVMIHGGTEKIPFSPVEWAVELEKRGAGEIMLNSIDHDGEMKGYNLDLIRSVVSAVRVPVIAAGGAGGLEDLAECTSSTGASAVAAGAMFVFHGKHRAVLLSYVSEAEARQATWY
jgi:cyclase